MSRSQRGRVVSSETRERLSKALLGLKHPPERRQLEAAAARSRRPLSPEQQAAKTQRLAGNSYVKDASIKGTCVYCGAPATTFDHFIARGRPGWDDPDNLVPACLWCNQSKSDRSMEDWIAHLERTVERGLRAANILEHLTNGATE